MFKDYLNITKEERTVIALEASNNLVSLLELMFEDEPLYEAYLQIYAVLCCADDEIKYEEYELFLDITGANVSYDDFYNAMRVNQENLNIDEFFNFVNEQEQDFIGYICVLAVCVFTCDGSFDECEYNLINKYLLLQE
jgi:hypothetical protein